MNVTGEKGPYLLQFSVEGTMDCRAAGHKG
jgi:hypothetical protein